MCGICGRMTDSSIDPEELRRMNDTMTHRGPDDSGVKIFKEHGKQTGLAQRRLAIQDLSELGHQPMSSADGSVWIVFNGEIYNFRELRRELTDYPFRSECDTEVILALYQRYGIRCMEKMNGMFALAIYDMAQDVLYLARDRMGQKPLYYYHQRDEFIFASELKPLMACAAFEKKINERVLKRFLFHGYIKGPDTIFEHVYKLPAGCYLEYRNREVRVSPYWTLFSAYQECEGRPVSDYRAAKEMLTQELKKAVKYRMIADVPVGAFLSGGYDSSLITAMACEVSPEPVKTYAIGFGEKNYNEAPYAKKVAEHLGTDHTEYYITETDMLSLVEDLTCYYDEPFADSSQIPSMLVAKLAARDVKVALSGDAGDELFGGYDYYEVIKKAQDIQSVVGVLRKILSISPAVNRAFLKRKMPESVRGMLLNEDRRYQTQFFDGSRRALCDEIMGNRADVGFEEEFLLGGIGDWQLRRMLLDLCTYLPDDILCKVDRATMKYSLEARCPLLDYHVVECSFRIPQKFKCSPDGGGKYILKQIARDYVPAQLLDRPKKGFSVPLDQWLNGPLKEMFLDYTADDFIIRQGLFRPEKIRMLREDFLNSTRGETARVSRTIWNLFVLQKWYYGFFG